MNAERLDPTPQMMPRTSVATPVKLYDRPSKVDTARARAASGYYDRPEVLEAAIGKTHDAIAPADTHMAEFTPVATDLDGKPLDADDDGTRIGQGECVPQGNAIHGAVYAVTVSLLGIVAVVAVAWLVGR